MPSIAHLSVLMAHPIHQANEKSPFGDLTRDQFYQNHQVLHQETSFQNHNNMNIFTQSWRPADSPDSQLTGIVAMIHGYNSESSWIFELTAVAIARLGFLALALDLRGHGRSDGPRSHLPSLEPVISDCTEFFDSARSAHPSLPAFLYGESLGGAIAILIALRQKSKWDGLILNGAMCGVSSKFKPIWPLEKFLPAAAFVAPNWRVVFTKSLLANSYKEKWKRELVRRNPRGQKSAHPTAATALESLKICEEIERKCSELEVPLLVLHGESDSVCDSKSAELVFNSARSKDKTLKILPGMWHQLIGEPEETVDLGFGIIFSWLRDRAKKISEAGAHEV